MTDDAYEAFVSELGFRLRDARQRAGLTQGEVARLLGCDRTTLSLHEKARRAPSLRTLCDLADAYGTTLSALFAELGEGAPSDAPIAGDAPAQPSGPAQSSGTASCGAVITLAPVTPEENRASGQPVTITISIQGATASVSAS